MRNIAPAALKSIPISPDAFAAQSRTTVYWLGGAGFMLNVRGKIILIDPVMKTAPGDPNVCETGHILKIRYPIGAQDVPKVDMVLYTHPDEDHMGEATVKDLAKLDPQFIGPPLVFRKLVSLGVHTHIEMCWEKDQFELDGIKIEVTPADHPWQLQDPMHCGRVYRREDCCGYMLTTPDGKLFFPGDTRLMEEHLEYRDVTLLALDVSLCPYHLNHPGAIVLANLLPDAYLIPYHYGTFDEPAVLAYCGDPMDVLSRVENPGRGRIYTPGEAFVLQNGKKQDI